MTDFKRFVMPEDDTYGEDVTLVDNVTGKKYESNFSDIVDLMNGIDDENFQLKRIIKKHCPPYIWNRVKLGDY